MYDIQFSEIRKALSMLRLLEANSLSTREEEYRCDLDPEMVEAFHGDKINRAIAHHIGQLIPLQKEHDFRGIIRRRKLYVITEENAC